MKSNKHYDNVAIEYREDINGYVGTDGRFWGKDEHMARWTSCDTLDCATEGCSNVITKGFVRCMSCQEKRARDKWEEADKRPVGENDMMYWSEACDKYFQEWEEVDDHCQEFDCKIEDLLLYHCERESPPQVDLDMIYEDITPEDLDINDMISDEIDDLVRELNDALLRHTVNCFRPSKIAVEI